MEIEGFDIRIAVTKIKSYIETFSHANISLTYTNKSEHSNDDLETIFLRKTHCRHAILDLNNSFDLLVQIPWFTFRIWEFFNAGGSLRTNKLNNNITRNTEDWVSEAEKCCNVKKVMKYFENSNDPNIKALKLKFKAFTDDYIFNETKPFTIRTLVNQMKHNHSLNFKEFYVPNNLNLNVNGEVVNLKDINLKLQINQKFHEINSPSKELGEMKISYDNDLKIDIHYKNGEEFFAEDYLRLNKMVSIDDIYSEAIQYGNALSLLYEDLFKALEPEFVNNPVFSNQKTTTTASINLDNHFKNME